MNRNSMIVKQFKNFIAIKISTWHSLSCGKVDRFVSDCLVKKLFADILNCFIAGAWTAYCAHARMMP